MRGGLGRVAFARAARRVRRRIRAAVAARGKRQRSDSGENREVDAQPHHFVVVVLLGDEPVPVAPIELVLPLPVPLLVSLEVPLAVLPVLEPVLPVPAAMPLPDGLVDGLVEELVVPEPAPPEAVVSFLLQAPRERAAATATMATAVLVRDVFMQELLEGCRGDSYVERAATTALTSL